MNKTNKFSPKFFILGCVRSGTTMLRDIFKKEETFFCPEETHFYRWAWPFGTNNSIGIMKNNGVLKKHREIDGISEEKFVELVDKSTTRHELMVGYNQLLGKLNPKTEIFYEKTPQNIYGINQIAQDFPNTKLIFLSRNPLNVAASLKVGKVMKSSLKGAINYWLESELIMESFIKGNSNRVFKVNYEDFTNNPRKYMLEMIDFLGLEKYKGKFENIDYSFIRPEHNKFREVLNENEIDLVKKYTKSTVERLNYKFSEY